MKGVRSLLAVASLGLGLSIVWMSATPAAQPRPSRSTTHVVEMFQTAQNCLACHNGLTTPAGEDVSIGSNWRGSMMANSSRDPYWQASVRRETLDHPALRADIEDECATCHMPMMRAQANAAGAKGAVFAHLPVGRADSAQAALAADGVSCTMCHQIGAAQLGAPESFTGGFVVDQTTPVEKRPIFGPFQVDRGRTTIMQSATAFTPSQSAHVQQSELCATCHTLYTTARGPSGEAIGRLPEQVPYLEWRHSAFRDQQSCQSCHMPAVAEAMPIASVLGEPRTGLARHTFIGGNFFVQRMLNRFRTELGVTALPQELDAAARATIAQLERQTADVRIGAPERSAGRLQFSVVIRNLTGHKLPTGYPSRRVWVHVTVRNESGQPLFESGALEPTGQIVGNAADADGAAFEPHYAEIRRPDQVQVYESVMVGADGRPTTGLLRGVRFAKDNRLLPRGFEKQTATADIAVQGTAIEDPDFTGEGDQVRYVIETPGVEGPVLVDVKLWYQPIAFRWADNLRPYDASETRRFVSYYEAMSPSSAVILAQQSVTVR